MNNEIIKVRNLKKHYKTKDGTLKALDGVDLSIKEGEIVGVIGESGCGKSTLAKLIIGLNTPTEGEILYKDKSVEEWLRKDKLKFRRDLQMIFQNPYDVFDSKMKIEEILLSPLKIHKIGQNKNERLDIIRAGLSKAGFKNPDDFLKRYPRELSGGQLQRISIVRSMLLKPNVIIADEPVSMLDVSIRADIINMLIDIRDEMNVSMFYISHDIPTTQFLVQKLVVMYLGKIVEYGPTEMVINNPSHPYTKALISHVGSIDPTHKIDRIKLKGEVPKPIGTGPGCYFESRCYCSLEKCRREYPEFIEIEKDHYISCFNPENRYI